VARKIKDKKIDGFTAIDMAECTTRVAAARKAWDGYSDGQAAVHGPSLDRERKKLSRQGYKATYWVKDASPGRSVENGLSADGKTCVGLAFETKDSRFVKTAYNEPKQCVNPARKKSN